jgi:hypothetical protein
MYVARVPNRGSPPAVLLRESYREDGKVKNRTLANLSRWPEEKVDALIAVLKGRAPTAGLEGSFDIIRSLPHGHVARCWGRFTTWVSKSSSTMSLHARVTWSSPWSWPR